MNARSGLFNQWVALIAAVAVAAGAAWGSAAALLEIAHEAGMSVPWSLPLGLDAVAVVAATTIQGRRSDRLAWVTLIIATGLSTVLQWLVAPDGLVNHVAHAVPPVAVLVAFELFLRTSEQANSKHRPMVTAKPRTRAGHTRPAPPEPASTPDPTPKRPPLLVDELVVLGRQVVADLEADGRVVTRRGLIEGLRAAGQPIGTTRANALLAQLRNDTNGNQPVAGEPQDIEPVPMVRALEGVSQ